MGARKRPSRLWRDILAHKKGTAPFFGFRMSSMRYGMGDIHPETSITARMSGNHNFGCQAAPGNQGYCHSRNL
jgi:hypothetical protein